MPTWISINVRNLASTSKSFFCFQRPSIYTGTGLSGDVYAICLYGRELPASGTPGVWACSISSQIYAGTQMQNPSPPEPAQPSGAPPVTQAIELTPPAGGPPTSNATTLSLTPSLALSVPTSTSGPPVGAFRIVTQNFTPFINNYNIGLALETGVGMLMSNFAKAQPSSVLDCQPSPIFYVQTGSYFPGTVIDLYPPPTNVAVCDATSGSTSFKVTYNEDGSWTVDQG
jgi:hypothetical protein